MASRLRIVPVLQTTLRFSAVVSVLSISGCANPGPNPPVNDGPTGKADGATSRNTDKSEYLQCVADECGARPTTACIEESCDEVLVELSNSCASCVAAYEGDAGLAATGCTQTVSQGPPCALDAALVQCAAAACDGMSGDPLLDCMDVRVRRVRR